jgi:hypothetical protein
MAEILTQKLKRNGWPEDEPMTMIDDSLLAYTEGGFEDDNEITKWREWRLDGKIVKRAAHVRLKKNVAAEAIAATFGG